MNKKSGLIEIEAGYVDWELTSDIIIDDEGNETNGKDYVKINNLFVKPDFRGQGYAKKLLASAIEIIKKSYPKIAIKIVPEPKEVSVDFDRLASFYDSMGLEVIAY